MTSMPPTHRDSSIYTEAAFIVEQVPELTYLIGKRLLLTGATGFVGRWLLETLACLNDQLLDQGNAPCAVGLLTRSQASFARYNPHLAARPDFTVYSGDVTTFDYSALPDYHYVIHAAAPADPPTIAADPLGAMQTIVQGTERLLAWGATQPLVSLLFVSSGAIYGAQPAAIARVPETFAGGPASADSRSAYGESKRLAETMCAIYHERATVPARIARLFTFVGPFQSLDAGFAVTDFLRAGLAGQPLRINGDGTPLRSYCYGAEMAVWLWAMLLRAESGSVYNLGSDVAVSIRGLAEAVVAAFARHDQALTIEVARQPRLDQPPARYVPDVDWARHNLNVSLSVSLDDALERTLVWHLKSRQIR